MKERGTLMSTESYVNTCTHAGTHTSSITKEGRVWRSVVETDFRNGDRRRAEEPRREWKDLGPWSQIDWAKPSSATEQSSSLGQVIQLSQFPQLWSEDDSFS